MKKGLNIAIYIVSVAVLIGLLGWAESTRKQVAFNDLKVHIDSRDGNFFIDEREIEDKVFSYGFRPGNDPVVTVNIKELEQSFDEMPAVRKAEVYTTLDGSVVVEIKQRKPVARVMTSSGESFYLDTEGNIMPLSDKYTARVIIANGFIPVRYEHVAGKNFSDSATLDMKNPVNVRLYQIYTLATAFEHNEFWDSQFKQLYFLPDGDIEIVPAVGNQIIRIGGVDNLDEALTKLLVLYKEGLNKIGWNEYGYINLKYKNQIVCKKR